MKREILKLYKEAFHSEFTPSDQKSCKALNALLVLMAVFMQPYYIPLHLQASAPDENASQNGKIYWREYPIDSRSIFEPTLMDFKKTIAAWEKSVNHSFSELALASRLDSYFSDLKASEMTLFFENAILSLSNDYKREDIGRASSCLIMAYCALSAEECPRIGKYGRTSSIGKAAQPQLFLKTKAIFSNEDILAVVDCAVTKHNTDFALSYADLFSLTQWLIPYALSINTELMEMKDAFTENATEKIWRTFSALGMKELSARTTDEARLLAYINEKDNLIKEAFTATAGGLHFFGKDNERKAFVENILSDLLGAINAFEKLHGELTPRVFTAGAPQSPIVQRRDQDLEALRQLRTQVNSSDLAKAIEHMENRLSMIYALLIENPKKEKTTTRFFNYYFPTTLTLLSAYITAEKTGLSTENIEALKKNILENTKLLVSVFDIQIDAIFRNEALDVEVELRAFKGVMSLDGINREMRILE